MPLSSDLTLTEYPLWRRVNFSITTRIKHWFGIHTYVETLYPVFSEPEGLGVPVELIALTAVRECWVCGKLA